MNEDELLRRAFRQLGESWTPEERLRNLQPPRTAARWRGLPQLRLVRVAVACALGALLVLGAAMFPKRSRLNVSSTPPSVSASVSLRQGEQANAGHWYSVTWSGLRPHQRISIVCRDTADPLGFHTARYTSNGAGGGTQANVCFSGDGPEHWVTADELTSNRVVWDSGAVELHAGETQGDRRWYSVTVSGFTPRDVLSATCHDSRSPEGFHTESITVDSSGTALVSQLCASNDGPDHWVTVTDDQTSPLGIAYESNHVEW